MPYFEFCIQRYAVVSVLSLFQRNCKSKTILSGFHHAVEGMELAGQVLGSTPVCGGFWCGEDSMGPKRLLVGHLFFQKLYLA